MAEKNSSYMSQAEVDALLSGDAKPSPTPEAARQTDQEMRHDLVRYDFRRRERFSGDQLRAMELLYERYSRQLGGTLSAYLRTTATVSVGAIEQLTYAEFLMSLSETTAMWTIGLEPVGGVGAIELNPESAYAVVDAMMAGRGPSKTEERALTEIELSLV